MSYALFHVLICLETPKGNATFSITCGIVPENLVDVTDFECSLCLR